MPYVDQAVADSYVHVKVKQIWLTASGADACLETYLKQNNNFRFKLRSAFRRARRKGVNVDLGVLGSFENQAEFCQALIGQLDVPASQAARILGSIERDIDHAIAVIRHLPKRQKPLTPLPKSS